MGLSRTSFYDQPRNAADDTAIVEAIATICNEFEHYGWRPWPPQSKDVTLHPAACIIPTADHNMPRLPIVITLPRTA
ncbi:hypothetical protein [Nitrobacter hamburgensis]|uniref:hypothetical protein n=1 Tax=Nitrobacter hamburgensis TaxID=912 RepID=UPI0003072EE5|nr:hypothetical protein [Nitrobacter hamburgensis]